MLASDLMQATEGDLMGQPLKTPDITPLQVPALVAAAGQAIAALGIVTPSAAQEASVSKVLMTTVGIAVADAIVRVGRSIWKGLEARAGITSTDTFTFGDPTNTPIPGDLSDSAPLTTPAAAAAALGVRS